MAVNNPYTWGLGRRKTSVARVRIKPGSGSFIVNGKSIDDYFVTTQERNAARAPLNATETNENFDVWVNVHGGACAQGHPIGSTGSRIIVTLMHALQHYGKSKGVAALCIGGGEATAIGIELI